MCLKYKGFQGAGFFIGNIYNCPAHPDFMLLIGTVHIDIEGPKRLEHFLNKYAPRKITVEVPKGRSVSEIEYMTLRERENRVKQVQQAGLPPQVQTLLEEIEQATGYEAIVAIQYAKRTGAELYFVDIPKIFDIAESNKKITFDESMKHVKNITYEQFREAYVKAIDSGYFDPLALAQILQNVPEEILEAPAKDYAPILEDKFWDEREQFMADEIARIQPDIHISGLAHIFEEFSLKPGMKSLYQRLAKYSPERVKLCEAAA